MHEDLAAILAADEEARRRVASARDRLARDVEAARAAADQARAAALARRTADVGAAVLRAEREADVRRQARESARLAERQRRHDRGGGVFDEAVQRFMAVVLGSIDAGEERR